MKKSNFLSCVLALSMILNMLPVASATGFSDNDIEHAPLSEVVTSENYASCGVETQKVRYNIIVNYDSGKGQFAIVFLDSPDYMYEYCFDVCDALSDASNILWEDLRTFCFAHKEQWTEIYLPSAVTSVDIENSPEMLNNVSKSDAADTFIDWIIDKYGNEYIEKLLAMKPQTPYQMLMYLKEAFAARAHKSFVHYLNTTMTIAGFITGVLGLSSSHPVISTIGAIVGIDGLLRIGESVYQYSLSAIWSRYVTLVSGEGYPYGMCDKSIYYSGYQYTETGVCNVDESSEYTAYGPSSTVYNSYWNIYDAAYEEYSRICWQD